MNSSARCPTLPWAAWAKQRTAWFAGAFCPPSYRYPFHKHSFAEVFWISQGRIRHRVGEREELLEAGDVRFIHPDTAHALAADGISAIIATLVFPTTLISQLESLAGPLPFASGKAPGARLGIAGRTELEGWGARLSNKNLTLLEVSSFLLWLVAELRRADLHDPVDETAWLTQAVVALDDAQRLAEGAQAFVRSTGRSAGLVAKQVRKQFGSTVIQLINQRRVAWLAQQLRSTTTPIPELAASCGLTNLSHCYKLFRAAYNCSPGKYRDQTLE